MQTWLSNQKQLIDSWGKALNSSSEQGSNPDTNFATQGIQDWWQKAQIHSPEINQLFDKVAAMGNSYMQFAEQVYKTGNTNENEIDILQWLEHSEQLNKNWILQLSALLEQQDTSTGEITQTNWQSWRELSRQVFEICNRLQNQFGDFKIPGAEHTQDGFFNLFDMAESVFFRQAEDEIQQHLVHFNHYKKANVAYSLILAKNSLQATQILKDNFSQPEDDSDLNISSLRALYDHWVTVNEKVYAESALSPEYRQAYGELLNSYLTFKKGLDDSLARHYQPFNLTSRTELDSLLESHQLLQRENKLLREELHKLSSRIDALENKNNDGGK